MSRESCVPRIVRQYEPDLERQLQALDMLLHTSATERTDTNRISRLQRRKIAPVSPHSMSPVPDPMEGGDERQEIVETCVRASQARMRCCLTPRISFRRAARGSFWLARLQPAAPLFGSDLSLPAEALEHCVSALRPVALLRSMRSVLDVRWRLRRLPDPPQRTLRLIDALDTLPDVAPQWWRRAGGSRPAGEHDTAATRAGGPADRRK